MDSSANTQATSAEGDFRREYPCNELGSSAFRNFLMALCLVFIGVTKAFASCGSGDTALLLSAAQCSLGVLLVLTGLFFLLPVAIRAFLRQGAGKLQVVLTTSSLTIPNAFNTLDDWVGLDETTRIRLVDRGGKKTLRVRTRLKWVTLRGSMLDSETMIDEIAEALADVTGRPIDKETFRPWQFSLGSMFSTMTWVAVFLGFWMWTNQMDHTRSGFVSFVIISLIYQWSLYWWIWGLLCHHLFHPVGRRPTGEAYRVNTCK